MERLKLNIQLFGGSLAITAYETDVSIENNTSYIYVELKPSTNSTTYNEGGSAYVQATLTGQNDTYSIPKTYFKIGKGKTVTAYSGKIGPFHHNSNGSLNNVSISASSYIVSNTQPTATASVQMSTIPRASTISNVSGNTIGSPITVTISRQSSSFTHKLQVVYGEKRTDWIQFGSNLSATFTIPMDFCNSQYLTSTTSGLFIFQLVTMSNGEPIGNETPLYTIYVPDSVKPSSPSITKSDTTSNYSTHGSYVKGKSGLRVQSSANGSYGSTITSYTVKLKSGSTVLQTLTGSDVTFSNLNYTGTITIEVTATDTRNRSTANTTSISIADYANPNISVFKAERLNNDSTVTITYTASITNINSHNSNAKTFKIYKRQKGTSSWGTAIATYTSGYSYSGTKTETCSENYGWEFKIDATDSYTTTSKTAEVGTAFELINWGANGNSMAIGKVSEYDNTFEINLDTKFYKTINGISIDKFLKNFYVGTGVDLNDYKQAGQYGLYGNNTNAPTSDIGVLEVIEYSPDWIIQRFTNISYLQNTKTWQRTFHSGNTWTYWKMELDNISQEFSYSNTNIKVGGIYFKKKGQTVMFDCNGDLISGYSLPYGGTLYVSGIDWRLWPPATMRFPLWNLQGYYFIEITTDGKVYLYNYEQTSLTGPYNFASNGCYFSYNDW